MLESDILVRIFQNAIVEIESDHSFLKIEQMMIPQIRPIRKIPSPPTIMITPIIPLPRKINPLGMSKLIPHKSKIPLISQ